MAVRIRLRYDDLATWTSSGATLAKGEFGVVDDSGNITIYVGDSEELKLWSECPQVSGGIGGATTLGDLSDVNLTDLSSGNILRYDGTNWSGFDIDAEFVKFTDLPQYTDGTLDIAQESTLNNLIDLVNSLDLTGTITGIEAGNGIIVEELTNNNFRISLDPETILEIPQVLGGTGINVSVTTNEDFLVSVDSSIATLDGTQELTNKTINGVIMESTGGSFYFSSTTDEIEFRIDSSIRIDPFGATTGQSLVYDGTKWVPATVAGGPGDTDGMSGAPDNSKFVTWQSEPFLSESRVLTAGNGIVLNFATNALISIDPTLSVNGVEFGSSKSISFGIDALDDVNISSPSVGDILVFDGTEGWINTNTIFGGNASSFV